MTASEREGRWGRDWEEWRREGVLGMYCMRERKKRKNNSQTLVGVAHILAEDSHFKSQSPCTTMNINVFLLLK